MATYDRLFITEKSSVGTALAEVLSKQHGAPIKSQNGMCTVGRDAIAWQDGHLLELVDADEYDPELKRWTLEPLPIIPEPFKLTVIKDERGYRARRLALIASLIKEADVIVGGGDPDAEGQLLQDELLIYLRNRKPVLRFWANALDRVTLERALANLRPNEEYIGWYESALARSHSDWIYGINMTRACTVHARNAGADFMVSIGRVQTPTLSLIVNRELEIQSFKPTDFYVPKLRLGGPPDFDVEWSPLKSTPGAGTAAGVWLDARVDDEGRLLSHDDAQRIVHGVQANPVVHVASIEAKPGTQAAPLPFALSSLQSLCSKKFGLTAKQTLDVAQSLYTKKITSYPRVDCGYLPESQFGEAPEVLASLAKAPLPSAVVQGLLGAKPGIKSKAWDDSKVTAHHGIVPVRLDQPSDVAQLSPIEQKVYFEIVKRFILQFWPAAKFVNTAVVLVADPLNGPNPVGRLNSALSQAQAAGREDSLNPQLGLETFKIGGRRYTEEGWRAAFAVEADEDEASPAPSMPLLSVGQRLQVLATSVDSRQTKCPVRFTDDTLITAMKSIHRFMPDSELKKRLREGVGIGTEATRAQCIETLVKHKFVQRNGTELFPTADAMRFNVLLPPVMRNPDLTAMWQQMNDDVLARKATYKDFMAKLGPWMHKMIERSGTFFQPGQFGERRNASGAQVAGEKFTCFGEVEKVGCGSPLRLIPEAKGRYRAFFGCTNDACKKTFSETQGKPVERGPRTAQAEPTGPQCPQCGKGRLARRQRKDQSGYFWGCSSWKEGCSAIYADQDGEVDLSGSSRGSGWRNGAPPVVKPAGSTWKGRAGRPPVMPSGPRRTG